MTPNPHPTPSAGEKRFTYTLDRYRGGKLMAEGATVKANSLEEARIIADKLFAMDRDPNCPKETFELRDMGDRPNPRPNGEASAGEIDALKLARQSLSSGKCSPDGKIIINALIAARAEIDAAWQIIDSAFDIESRAELEKQALLVQLPSTAAA